MQKRLTIQNLAKLSFTLCLIQNKTQHIQEESDSIHGIPDNQEDTNDPIFFDQDSLYSESEYSNNQPLTINIVEFDNNGDLTINQMDSNPTPTNSQNLSESESVQNLPESEDINSPLHRTRHVDNNLNTITELNSNNEGKSEESSPSEEETPRPSRSLKNRILSRLCSHPSPDDD